MSSPISQVPDKGGHDTSASEASGGKVYAGGFVHTEGGRRESIRAKENGSFRCLPIAFESGIEQIASYRAHSRPATDILKLAQMTQCGSIRCIAKSVNERQLTFSHIQERTKNFSF